MGTIFPFRVSMNGKGKGYIELPYTLPQDFTIFILMGQTNIDIWKTKLDWVVKHGGMALLNTHPDYICFDGCAQRYDEYPINYYIQFLQYAKDKYEKDYWHVLPNQIALFINELVGRNLLA